MVLPLPLCPFHLYAESRSFADFRLFDVDAAVVVLFDDAFHKGEPQSPAPALGGIARVEYGFEPVAGNAFAGVFDVDVISGFIVGEGDVDISFAVHGVDGVFAKILEDPFYERTAQGLRFQFLFGGVHRDVHFSRDAVLHVVDGRADDFTHVGRLTIGLGADFRETLGDGRQPLHVFPHVVDDFRVGAL